MAFLLNFFIFYCYLTFAICLTDDDLQPAFVGGINAVVGEFPSVVSITSTVGPLTHCLGNVVNDFHVVTSARCVLDNQGRLINSYWLTINGGDLNLNQPTFRNIKRNVTTIYVHPSFNSTTGTDDIAVLRVGERFPFPHNTIEGAERSTRPISANSICFFSGWGSTTNGSTVINPIKRKLEFPILRNSVCNNAGGVNNRLTALMICGGTLAASNPSLCHGNIGGGLYCHENLELAGILSFGTGCAVNANQPSAFTDIRHYNTWINQQFNRTVRFPPGTLLSQMI